MKKKVDIKRQYTIDEWKKIDKETKKLIISVNKTIGNETEIIIPIRKHEFRLFAWKNDSVETYIVFDNKKDACQNAYRLASTKKYDSVEVKEMKLKDGIMDLQREWIYTVVDNDVVVDEW